MIHIFYCQVPTYYFFKSYDMESGFNLKTRRCLLFCNFYKVLKNRKLLRLLDFLEKMKSTEIFQTDKSAYAAWTVAT